MDNFNKECLAKHNEYRAKHGCPPLVYSAQLAESAQNWADQLGKTGKLAHCPESHGKRGENVAMKFVEGGTEFKGDQAAAQWYCEIKDFKFGEENQVNCGHFSQVVWKSTKECGFGRSQHPSGKVFIVGQYLPPANEMNKWTENIPSPVNGKVEVPTEEEVMGPKPKPSAATSHSGLQGEGKHGPDDVLVGKQTKSKTSGGVKTQIITETYQKPDGSQFQVTIEKKSGLEDNLEQLRLNNNMTNSQSNNTKGRPMPPMLGQDTNDFAADVLDSHNHYRRMHGAPPLKRNRELDKIAQEWADHLASTCTFAHSKNTYRGGKLGENISCKWGSGVRKCAGREVVHQWYTEEPKCVYGENPKALDAGHFSQVVWMESQELGTGYAVDSNGKHITVCNYFPAGNMMGKFPSNVKPPIR